MVHHDWSLRGQSSAQAICTNPVTMSARGPSRTVGRRLATNQANERSTFQ